jgi:tetratricopeptide (TPR) repeat protein
MAVVSLGAEKAATAAEPDSQALKMELAQASLKLADRNYLEKNYKDAIEAYTVAVRYDPLNGHIWFGLGNCYVALGNRPKALECYEKAGNADFFNDNRENAVQAFHRVFEINPQDKRAESFLEHMDQTSFKQGETLLKQRKYVAAIRAFKKGLEYEPLNGRAWEAVGMASLALGNQEEAFTAFRTSGYAYFFQCERVCAADAIKKALQLLPDNAELTEFLKQLEPENAGEKVPATKAKASAKSQKKS